MSGPNRVWIRTGGKMSDTNIISQGIGFYNSRMYSDALSFFLSLPSDSGADAEDISYYLGLCYTKLKRYEDALLYLEQVVTSGKNQERIRQCRFLLAIIYAVTGRKRLANFELEKLVDTGYKTAEVCAAMAFIAWENKEFEACEILYSKSLSIDPDNVTALNGMGYILACQEKDLTKALSCCKKAVEFAPKSAACLDSLGYVYYKLGLFNDAKKYLEQAESIDGQNEEIASHIKSLMLESNN